MGAVSSKSKKKKGKKGKNAKEDKKEDKKASYGKKGSPDALRNEITDIYNEYKADRKKIEPLYHEKVGLSGLVHDERERLLTLLAQQDAAKKEREPMMAYTWDRDADDIRRAFTKSYSADKAVLIDIMATRAKWQLAAISEMYEKKFGVTLLQQIVRDLKTFFGGLFTGTVTGLCTLLTNRVLPQAERDAAFLREFSDGYVSLSDEGFLEIVCTRSNEELRCAMDEYKRLYGKNLVDVVKAKTSYSYRDLLVKILECKRDEMNKPFDDETAEKLAKELYDAGVGRLVGVDAPVFVRILSTINRVQFDSINAKYKNKQLMQDIHTKFGGDFEQAVKILVSDKYEYLAGRMEAFLRGYSTDKDGICRVMGSLARWECVKVKEAYDRGGYDRTLEDAIKKTIREKNYQLALLTLISGDISKCPLGSDRELVDDENEVKREGERTRAQGEMNYRSETAVKRGQQMLKGKKKTVKKKPPVKKSSKKGATTDDESEEGKKEKKKNKEEEALHVEAEEVDDLEDEDIPKFSWDGKGRFLDKKQLKAVRDEAKAAREAIAEYRTAMEDEINGVKETYYAVMRLCHETEVWIRIYENHVKCLKEFVVRRDRASGLDTPEYVLGMNSQKSASSSNLLGPVRGTSAYGTAAGTGATGGALLPSSSHSSINDRGGGGGRGGNDREKEKEKATPARVDDGSALSKLRKGRDKETPAPKAPPPKKAAKDDDDSSGGGDDDDSDNGKGDDDDDDNDMKQLNNRTALMKLKNQPAGKSAGASTPASKAPASSSASAAKKTPNRKVTDDSDDDNGSSDDEDARTKAKKAALLGRIKSNNSMSAADNSKSTSKTPVKSALKKKPLRGAAKDSDDDSDDAEL